MRTALLLTLLTLTTAARAADPAWIVRSDRGLVASDSREASQIGAQVLADGGNAFDAAVATSFALGVARPYSTGLGGGGFMVAYLAKEDRIVVLDFREQAPAKATPALYAAARKSDPNGPPPSVYGGLAVGVPGLLAGLDHMNRQWGTMPLKKLIEPAIGLARTGPLIDENFQAAATDMLGVYAQYPQMKNTFPDCGLLFLNRGAVPPLNSRKPNPGLAMALQRIADEGPRDFYEGKLAQSIVDNVYDTGGHLTLTDLKNYRVKERQPIRGRFGAYEIISMPPPSSGGIALVQSLNTLTAWREQNPDKIPQPGTPAAAHLLIEVTKQAFADRARWLGDADFAKVPVAHLIDPAYATKLAQRITLDQPRDPNECGTRQLPDDGGTSHFCVVDRDGNVVAITETINAGFGSFVVIAPYGIVLNNEMDDFVTQPGQANLYGLVQGDANLVAPGKRPLSSMSPTIVLKDGKPMLALGASGGPRIITAVLQVMLGVIDEGRPLEQAIERTRLHHQWQPDVVYFDRDPDAKLADGLKELGHDISPQRRGAVVQAIVINETGQATGASDPRKGGQPAAPPKAATTQPKE